MPSGNSGLDKDFPCANNGKNAQSQTDGINNWAAGLNAVTVVFHAFLLL